MSLAPVSFQLLAKGGYAMAPRTSSILIADVAPRAEREQLIRRESIRDFAGVALGVSVGALVWLALVALFRLQG